MHRTREGCRLARNEPDSARSLCELLMTEQRFTTTMGSFRKIRGTVQPTVTVGDSSGRSARISLTNIARRRHAHSQTSVFGELGRVERESTLLHPLHKLAAKRAIGTKPYSRRFRGTPGRFRCTCTSHGVASKTAHVSRQIPACYPGAANKIRRQMASFRKNSHLLRARRNSRAANH